MSNFKLSIPKSYNLLKKYKQFEYGLITFYNSPFLSEISEKWTKLKNSLIVKNQSQKHYCEKC